MDTIAFKNGIFLSLMLCFLGMAFLTNDVIHYHLFASLSVIFAACAFHYLSNPQPKKYEGEPSHEQKTKGYKKYKTHNSYERFESFEEV